MASPVTVRILGDSADLQRALNTSSDATKKWSGKAKAAFMVAGAAAGAFAIKFGVDSVKAAADDEQAQVKLAKTLHNTADATKKQVEGAEKWIEAQGRALGVTDDQLRPALARAATSTGNLADAQKLVSQAMDISAATGKPLQAVTEALAKASDGSTAAVKKYGVQVKNADGSVKSFSQIQDELNKKFGGDAANAADTSAGKMAILKVRLDEAKESIGGALLPILDQLTTFFATKVIPIVESTVKWFGEHKAIVMGLAAVIGPLVVVLGALKLIQQAVTVAQAAMNLVMSANPIILVILGIAALVAGLVVAYQHFAWFSVAVDAVWNVLKTGFQWITSNWPLLLAILTGPIGIAVLVIARNWDSIIGFFKAAPGTIGEALKDVGGAILSPFKWAFKKVAELWNATLGKIHFSLPSWIPGLGGKSFGFPLVNVAGLAEGGVVTRPTLALIGEGGENEAVVPLSKAGSMGFGGGGRSLVVNVNGFVGSEAQLAREIKRLLTSAGLRGAV